MSEVLTQAKTKVVVYGCGGAGTNMAYQHEHMRGEDELGFAQLDIVYADTSRSNLRPDIPAKSVYLIEGKDGSGKIRSENHPEISGRIKDLLQKHPPGALSIVIHSLAGGTGSVIGPLLAKELLLREAPVVVIAVGDANTKVDASNTLKTIKSYESICSQQTNSPLGLHYLQNSATLSREEIDRRIASLITLLCALFSGENRELDSKDLFNFLRFNREQLTSFGPQLAALTVVRDGEPLDDLGNIISVATLVKDGQNPYFGRPTEVQFTGFLPKAMPEAISKGAPYHFVLSDGIVPEVASELQQSLRAIEESMNARIQRKSILTNADQHTDGLIL